MFRVPPVAGAPVAAPPAALDPVPLLQAATSVRLATAVVTIAMGLPLAMGLPPKNVGTSEARSGRPAIRRCQHNRQDLDIVPSGEGDEVMTEVMGGFRCGVTLG